MRGFAHAKPPDTPYSTMKLPKKSPIKVNEYTQRVETAADILAPTVLAVLSALYKPTGQQTAKKR